MAVQGGLKRMASEVATKEKNLRFREQTVIDSENDLHVTLPTNIKFSLLGFLNNSRGCSISSKPRGLCVSIFQYIMSTSNKR